MPSPTGTSDLFAKLGRSSTDLCGPCRLKYRQRADQTTVIEYDPVGRVQRIVYPDGLSVTNEYYPTGLLKKTSGARTYPVECAYDHQGRLTNMITWSDAATGGGAVTTWKYDGYRGFLTNKAYADGHGPSYAYTNSGKLVQRTWARGVNTSYLYNNAGDLWQVEYSDATPSLTNAYDLYGRKIQVNHGTNI